MKRVPSDIYEAIDDGDIYRVTEYAKSPCVVNRSSDEFLTMATPPIMYAITQNKIAIAQILIYAGADLSHELPNGWNYVTLAAFLGHADMVRLLVFNGMDYDIVDRYSMTPIMHAAANGHHDTVKVLLDIGAEDLRYLGSGADDLAFESTMKRSCMSGVSNC